MDQERAVNVVPTIWLHVAYVEVLQSKSLFKTGCDLIRVMAQYWIHQKCKTVLMKKDNGIVTKTCYTGVVTEPIGKYIYAKGKGSWFMVLLKF